MVSSDEINNSDSSSDWFDSDEMSSTVRRHRNVNKQKRIAKQKQKKTLLETENTHKLDAHMISFFETGKIYVGDLSKCVEISNFVRIELRGREEEFTVNPVTQETNINTNMFNIDYSYECFCKDTGEYIKISKKDIYEIKIYDDEVNRTCFIRDRRSKVIKVSLDNLVPCKIVHDYATLPHATSLLDTKKYMKKKDETKFTESSTKEFKELVSKYNRRLRAHMVKHNFNEAIRKPR